MMYPPDYSLDPYLTLASAETALSNAQEILHIAEERLITARERVKSLQTLQNWTQEELRLAQRALGGAERLLMGTNALCRLGEAYLLQIPRESQSRRQILDLIDQAYALTQESSSILTTASGQVSDLKSHLNEYTQRIELDQKRYQYEVGVWFNANELLTLAEQQVERAKIRVHTAEDRVSRAKDRVRRTVQRSGRSYPPFHPSQGE